MHELTREIPLDSSAISTRLPRGTGQDRHCYLLGMKSLLEQIGRERHTIFDGYMCWAGVAVPLGKCLVFTPLTNVFYLVFGRRDFLSCFGSLLNQI